MSNKTIEDIEKQIKPIIERMSLELVKKKPEDIVKINIIINKYIGKIHDRIFTEVKMKWF